MTSAARNVALLKDAYQRWHESRGRDPGIWLDLVADDVKMRSLAAGGSGAPFTSAINGKADLARYFDGLLADWEMIEYKTVQFIAEGDRVAVLGSTAWKNLRTGKTLDTPKADFWELRDGRVVEMREFYNTSALVFAATP
jgi:ketosteroid isomerase-like protein